MGIHVLNENDLQEIEFYFTKSFDINKYCEYVISCMYESFNLSRSLREIPTCGSAMNVFYPDSVGKHCVFQRDCKELISALLPLTSSEMDNKIMGLGFSKIEGISSNEKDVVSVKFRCSDFNGLMSILKVLKEDKSMSCIKKLKYYREVTAMQEVEIY